VPKAGVWGEYVGLGAVCMLLQLRNAQRCQCLRMHGCACILFVCIGCPAAAAGAKAARAAAAFPRLWDSFLGRARVLLVCIVALQLLQGCEAAKSC
jgi:hypothetical protein